MTIEHNVTSFDEFDQGIISHPIVDSKIVYPLSVPSSRPFQNHNFPLASLLLC